MYIKKRAPRQLQLGWENVTLTCRSRRSAVERTGTNLGRGTFMATPPSKNCTGNIDIILLSGLPQGIFLRLLVCTVEAAQYEYWAPITEASELDLDESH